MSEENKSIQDNVLAAIKAGQVHMKPRWHFVLQTILFVVGLVLVILASLFVGSFILFMLHQNGAWFATSFGGPGFAELFSALPVLLILVAVVFIILLQILVRRYSFAYGKPTLYTVIAIVVLVILGSFILENSHFHEGLFNQAENNQLPFAGGFYRQFGESQAGHTTPGKIIEKTEEGFIILDPHGTEYSVVVNDQTRLPYGDGFEVGDNIIVLGDRNGNTITATGVRSFDADEHMFDRRGHNDKFQEQNL